MDDGSRRTQSIALNRSSTREGIHIDRSVVRVVRVATRRDLRPLAGAEALRDSARYWPETCDSRVTKSRRLISALEIARRGRFSEAPSSKPCLSDDSIGSVHGHTQSGLSRSMGRRWPLLAETTSRLEAWTLQRNRGRLGVARVRSRPATQQALAINATAESFNRNDKQASARHHRLVPYQARRCVS